MNTEEDNSWKGELTTPTWEEELVVELNPNIVKTIQSLQEDLESFKDDNMNERKEQQEINESLLLNMPGRIPHGQPTRSTNKTKENNHCKQGSGPREGGKEEHTLELLERDYNNISSDNPLSPWRKSLKLDANLQRVFRKIKSPTYEGEMNTGEKVEELGISKYFRVHN